MVRLWTDLSWINAERGKSIANRMPQNASKKNVILLTDTTAGNAGIALKTEKNKNISTKWQVMELKYNVKDNVLFVHRLQRAHC